MDDERRRTSRHVSHAIADATSTSVADADAEPALGRAAQLRPPRHNWKTPVNSTRPPTCIARRWPPVDPDAETCFLLAELLYRLGDAGAARERYYMAIELDEDYVEARANLGCVLAEMGQHDLAAAAFTGALAHHGDYPDAHYHLARSLDELGRADEAEVHWRAFLELAPDSPWSVAARDRLGSSR